MPRIVLEEATIADLRELRRRMRAASDDEVVRFLLKSAGFAREQAEASADAVGDPSARE